MSAVFIYAHQYFHWGWVVGFGSRLQLLCQDCGASVAASTKGCGNTHYVFHFHYVLRTEMIWVYARFYCGSAKTWAVLQVCHDTCCVYSACYKRPPQNLQTSLYVHRWCEFWYHIGSSLLPHWLQLDWHSTPCLYICRTATSSASTWRGLGTYSSIQSE